MGMETSNCRKIDGMMLTWDGHRGRHLSYQRGKRNTNPGTSLIQIEGVENTEAAKYVGESVCKMVKY
jgi:ribosomal protein L35AE/L33A